MNVPNEDHLTALKKYFGYSKFRPKQWEIISHVLGKEDTCVVMATGYGKSLCYQFPPVYLNKLAIVVSPLISLMEDQVLGLKMCNIPACQLGSSQNDKKRVMEGALRGDYRLIYVTPEWCQNSQDFFTKLNNKCTIILVAIDEAHCISQWGFDFRASYRHLGKLRAQLPDVPFMAVTATATPQVRSDICHSLKLRSAEIICSSFDRPNLYLSASLKGKDVLSDITPLLNKVKLMNGSPKGSTIIYCPTKKVADTVADCLNAGGVDCALYHADLSLKRRREVHEKFVKDIVPIIVATVAFGMGIDKPDVRLVVHYGAPKDLESFYQEIGRAGRDGLQSYCHTFYSQADFQLSEYFFKNLSGEFLKHKRKLASILQYYLQTTECRRKILLSHFDPLGDFRSNTNCCDNCSRGPKKGPSYDLTDDALLLLEAVKTFNGKFGLSVSIFLLRGSENKRLPRNYYSHSLYGAGNRKPEVWWKCLGKLLQREGLLELTVPVIAKGKQNYFYGQCISLTSTGQKYLDEKGGVHLELTEEMMDLIRIVLPRTNRLVEAASGSQMLTSEDTCEVVEPKERKLRETIFNGLMNLRSELSKKHNCMPYMIASLKTLQDLSVKRPDSLKKLSEVEGMTEAKVDNYGQSFLDCILERLLGDFRKPTQKVESVPISTNDWLCVEMIKKKESAQAKTSKDILSLEMDSEEDELFTSIENDIYTVENGAKIDDNDLPSLNSEVECKTMEVNSEPILKNFNKTLGTGYAHLSEIPKTSVNKNSPHTSYFSDDRGNSSRGCNTVSSNVLKSCTKRRVEYVTDSDSDDASNQPKQPQRNIPPRKKAQGLKSFCL